MYNSRYGEIVDRVVPGLLQPGISFERIVREGASKGLYGEPEDGVERWVSQRLEDHRNLPSVRQHRLGDGSWVQVRGLTTALATKVLHRTIKIDGLDIFFREAGRKDDPTILLLHGFPTSSHMFRNLMPTLADEFHLIAPDYPGYGNSSMPKVEVSPYFPARNLTRIRPPRYHNAGATLFRSPPTVVTTLFLEQRR